MGYAVHYLICNSLRHCWCRGKLFCPHTFDFVKSLPPSFVFIYVRRGGLTVSVLVSKSNDQCSSPDLDAELNSWARHVTLAVPQLPRCIYGIGKFTPERQLAYCYRNRDKLRLYGPLGSDTDFLPSFKRINTYNNKAHRSFL